MVCTDLDSEAMKHDTVTEEEESIQVRGRVSCCNFSALEIQVLLRALM